MQLQTSTKVVGEKSDSQVLNHGVFTMLMRQMISNTRPNQIPFINKFLSDCKIKIVSANARLMVIVDSWSTSTRTTSSTLPTMNFEGIVGKDELTSQSTYDVGTKEIQPHYEGLFGNETPIQEDQLLCIYTKLLKALNEIRLQNATNFGRVMKFKGKSFNTFVAQVKEKELVTYVDDIEVED